MPLRFNNRTPRQLLFFIASSRNPHRNGENYVVEPEGYFIVGQYESGLIRNWFPQQDVKFHHGEHDAWVGKEKGALYVGNLAKPTIGEKVLIRRGKIVRDVQVRFLRTRPQSKETF